jgi:hypothetical protein
MMNRPWMGRVTRLQLLICFFYVRYLQNFIFHACDCRSENCLLDDALKIAPEIKL